MVSFCHRMHNNKCKKAKPLVKPPMRSRKKARQVTTLFHKYTREREIAARKGNAEAVQHWEQKIEEIGGREEYQRASQLNTSFHSTSKWVLAYLSNHQKWLTNGIIDDNKAAASLDETTRCDRGRKVRLLEVGAINTVLLHAAEKHYHKYLSVRAIDLRSSHEQIEEIDFFQLAYLHEDPNERYDAIVCSMVLNCVTTPEERGKMLWLLKNHLRPGGILFLTIPLLCLTQSPYMTKELFMELLAGSQGIGFEFVEKKESPKIAFFILRRPPLTPSSRRNDLCVKAEDKFNPRWKKMVKVRHGKKYRNPFAVVLLDK